MDARAGVRRIDRLRRPGQLRHEHRRRRPLRLSAAVGRPGRQPDGDAGAVPVGQARHRHRTEPAPGGTGPLPAGLHVGHVGAGRGDGDVHRHRRVPGRGARLEPSLRRAATAGGPDHRRDRVCHPRAAVARIPPLRARDFRAAWDRLSRLPLRDAAHRPVDGRVAPRLHAGPQRNQLALHRRRHRRRDSDAPCHLPALRADAGARASAAAIASAARCCASSAST